MNDLPKYSHLEVERRWLVDLSHVGDLSAFPCREIEDKYISDSRLRLRKVSGPAGDVTFKFGKKYGKRTPLSEPMTNLYLTDAEYRQLFALPGRRTRKRRYAVGGGALDVYLEPSPGFAVFEVEFADERSALEYRPPGFATREITEEPTLTGTSLAE